MVDAPPCKDCITFPICKSQLYTYLKEQQLEVFKYRCWFELSAKCNLIRDYISKHVKIVYENENDMKMVCEIHLEKVFGIDGII